MCGPRTPAAELAKLAARLPVIVLARNVRVTDVIRTADDEGLRQAVEYLIGLGHQQIAHIDGGRAPGAADRRRGYREAMAAHSLDSHSRIVEGGLSEEDGAAAARRLLDEGDRPTAVTVFNDRSATGVLDVLTRAGLRVPEDISVVGYDDSHLARLAHINLTTIAQDAAEMTRLAVDRAIARIDGSELTNRASIVAPQLIIRGTTAPPAA